MLYLILSSNFLKVGYSKDVPTRLRAYNTCNPDYLLLDTVEGTLQDEAWFHSLIKEYHHKLEWYHFDQKIINIWNEQYQRNVVYMPVDWKSKQAKNLFLWLCNHVKFNTNKVLIPAGIRKQISNDLDMSTGSITNNLKALKDLNLISGEKGVFTINPQIFWKGDEKARKAFMCEQEIKIKFSI